MITERLLLVSLNMKQNNKYQLFQLRPSLVKKSSCDLLSVVVKAFNTVACLNVCLAANGLSPKEHFCISIDCPVSTIFKL